MDFLLSTGEESTAQLASALNTCGGDPENLALCEAGSWGSLIATRTNYRGLSPISGFRYLHLIVGDPLMDLPADREHAELRDRNAGRTIQIAKVWERIIAGEPAFLPWHPSLLLRLDKERASIEIVTDPAAFVTLYRCKTPTGILLATSPDLIAAVIRPSIDLVSVRERVASGQICYPYTLYEGIEQLPPGSIVTVQGGLIESRFWWHSPGSSSTRSPEILAQSIRETCKEFLSRLGRQVGRDGVLTLSAGGDTRFIADVIAESDDVDPTCVCTTAVENYESWTAKQVAQTLGLAFVHHVRPVDHHASCLLSPPLLIGTQANWEHCHFDGNGLGDRSDAGFVIGGYMADTFLVQADSYEKARRKAVTKDILDPHMAQWATHAVAKAFTPAQRDEITERRLRAMETLNLNAGVSEQIQNIWPFSRQWSKGHFEALRRGYPAYEFFMTTPMVELGVSIPAHDKSAMDKSLLLRPVHSELSAMPVNPESSQTTAKAVSQFKKNYPRELWPESIVYRGAWSEKSGAVRQQLDDAIDRSRSAVAALLGLETLETHEVWCYAIHQAMKLSAAKQEANFSPA